MYAQAAATASAEPLIQDPAGVLAVLLGVFGIIFWSAGRPVGGRLFKVVPTLLFCYFVPTLLTTLRVIPDRSPLYDWVKDFILPASLLFLVLSLDVPGIVRLGSKAVITFLAGTAGVMIGGPIALIICRPWLPPDAWQGMAALSGSWIGGAANFVAVGRAAGASDTMMTMMVIPDVLVAYVWMGILLYGSGHQHAIDRWSGADTSAIGELQRRMTEFHARVTRVPSTGDLIIILALGFVGSWASYATGEALNAALVRRFPNVQDVCPAAMWKYLIVTTLGVGLSFTPARNLEGAGASKLGTVMINLLVACIGAGASFRRITENPALILMACIWMACHVAVLFGVARLIRAPAFFVAVGSMANIGGAASAPVVAAAFHPALAAVGVLLAIAGYVLGTYAGLVCMWMLKWVAGAGVG